MSHHKIISRWNSNVALYEGEAESLRDLVASAAGSGANLRGADLSDADLRDANLRGADLSGANLRNADLRGADLRDANLRGADLSSANLRNADLRDADLRDADLSNANLRDADLSNADLSDADLSDADLRNADLRGADLRDANLRDADLSNANLRDANLRDADLSNANLRNAKADFFMTLLHAIPAERAYLRTALIEGRVNGSQYEGPCACLKGSLQNACGRTVKDMGLIYDVSEPAETFFLAISEGDTPETNSASKLAVEWLDEFEALTTNLIAPKP